MRVPLLDLKAQYESIRHEILASIYEVFETQSFILGPQVAALEEEMARLCEVPHAVGVASGTDALLLSLKALGAGPGDSVVTTPFTFFATAGAITNLGARPLFVDIDDSSFNMDPEALRQALEEECAADSSGKLFHKASATTVKAVLPVHLFGQCADMVQILLAAKEFGLPVVEDSCQSVRARYAGKPAGGMGDLGCFSFFPSKNLSGAGDGGMVVSRSSELAGSVRLLRTHGAEPRYIHKIVGFNSRLDEIQAAVVRIKLRHLETWTRARQLVAQRYVKEFEGSGLSDKVRLPAILPDRDHVFHQFVVRCHQRDKLQVFLRERNIDTEIYYPLPLHEQECFGHLGYPPTAFPRAHAAAQEVLALPIYPELTGDQITHVVSSIADFYN
jgi:dTDP-4-amino-4,6-dideoxygalactose transaminase